MTAAYTSDTDYRITGITVTSTSIGTVLSRAYGWTGDFLNGITDNHIPARTEAYTYSPAGRLLTATSGVWGALAWTYDASGNRTSDNWNGYLTNYTVAANSNRLTQTTAGGQTRAFSYDAVGNMIADSRTGVLGMNFEWDEEGRLTKSAKTADPQDASTFRYDARFRLASRVVSSAANPTGTFTGFIHDLADHIVAETDSSGNTQREYIWAGDIPIAVVGNVATSPALWFVHTDHLLRPARMTDASGFLVWDVVYRPFGEVNNISENPATNDMRFPGQWFQLQNGLAYNWHRHYDASLGRYVSSDPLGLTAMLSDGPNTYGYAGQRPGVFVDEEGLQWQAPLARVIQAKGREVAAATAAVVWAIADYCRRTIGGGDISGSGGAGGGREEDPCTAQENRERGYCFQSAKSSKLGKLNLNGCLERAAERKLQCVKNGGPGTETSPPWRPGSWYGRDEENSFTPRIYPRRKD